MTTEKMMEDGLIPFLKNDAQVTLTLGTGFIKQLPMVSNVLLTGKSEEDLKHFETLAKEDKELEPWMYAVQTIQALFMAVYKEAEKNGMIEYKPISEVL